jgi:2-dehydro-3-deoxygluconokinase
MVDILAIGEALAELVETGQAGDGSPMYTQGFGGDTSNAVIAAARQGASCGYLSAVGTDPFGDELINLWQREGVETKWVARSELAPTGAYFVKPDPAKRHFWYARQGSAASRYTLSETAKQAISTARVVHVSAISLAISAEMRQACFDAAHHARACGVCVSLDTNLRLNLWTLDDARETLGAFLPLTDIILPSDDEAALLCGSPDEADMLAYFGAHDPQLIVLKRGEKGSRILTRSDDFDVPAHAVKAVDSTGAGDSYAGAFLAYYLELGDAQKAAYLAAKVAAGTVSGLGAIRPIPRRQQVLANI